MKSISLTGLYNRSELEQMRRCRRLDPYQIRRLRNGLCKHFRSDSVIAEQFPFSKDIRHHSLKVHRRQDSRIDGATKLLLKTSSGALIEAVILRIASGRTTLCVSSQVGCAAACRFCATGHMGLARNLSSAEILDQVLLAGQLLAIEGRKLRNIVFMGMGEPFHNEKELFESLRILTSPEYFSFTPGNILVSSVGVMEGMRRCAQQFPGINQAISLHSTSQSDRESLIPLARKFPLAELHQCLQEINQLQSQPVMVEYLMLARINDSQQCVDRLIHWLEGLHVHVNLIPFNPIHVAPQLVGSSPATIRWFSRQLKSAGHRVTIRHSLGSDISGACGQLAQKSDCTV